MDHGSAVEKLEGVREIESSLRQDFLALFLIPFEFHRGNLTCVITICNHTCIHTVLRPPATRQADVGSTESNHALEERASPSVFARIAPRGPRGGIESQIPLRAIASYYPSAVDQALVARAYHGRIVALAQTFAGWAPRELGL